MHITFRALRRKRLLLLPTVLALPCLMAAPAVAAAHAQPAAVPASSAPSGPDGPWYRGTTLDFDGGRIAYTRTASGFDATGAYFHREVLHLGGDGGPRYEEIASHS